METPITTDDLFEMDELGRREVACRVNLHDGLVRALREARDVIESEYGRPCSHLDKIDAMLNLAGGIVEVTSVQIDALAAAVRCARGAARDALIKHDGDPIMAELALRRVMPVTGHQLREAVEFINPEGSDAPEQLDDDLTFGVVDHKDDDGTVKRGMCCWNDDSDGVLPLDAAVQS